MSLSPGTRLGPYGILEPIGAGGMGEVYRAADPRLHREVAIKVSTEHFSERFEREARAIASLNHPNICSLFDVGPNFLVMELVEGPTLAGCVNQGAIPMEESLEVARQIVDALEAAHEKGIVHRDLKPANIKIKPDGMVKVLDFGLAKMPEQGTSSGSPDESPTFTLEQTTKVGSIMGTAAYMSPEQASGKPVDKRADVWSFGVVLWEMMTGHRLFEGETISHTLADVLRGPIDFEKLPRETSPEIRELLRRCLDRNVKNRLRDIGEARVAINNPGRHLAVAAAAPPRRRVLPWAIAAVTLIVAAVVSFGSWYSRRPVEQPLLRLDVDLGAEVSLPPPGPGAYKEARLSPDGKRLALVVTDRGNQDIWVYESRRGMMTRLTFDGLHGDPVWSPDGRYVVFDTYTGGMFWTRSDGAGQPQPLTQTKNFQIPASFTPDGKHLAYHEVSSSDGGRRIWTVPVEDNGGTLQAGKPEQFLKTQFNEDFAAFSPDGRWMAYSSDESGKEEVYVRAFPALASGQGGQWQISNSGGNAPKWSRSGHELLYFSNNQIMAVSYSVKGDMLLNDKPRVWLTNAGQTQGEGCDECFDVLPDGRHVALLTPGKTKEAPKQEHEVVFLFNFFDELRRRVPVGK